MSKKPNYVLVQIEEEEFDIMKTTMEAATSVVESLSIMELMLVVITKAISNGAILSIEDEVIHIDGVSVYSLVAFAKLQGAEDEQ